MINRYLLLAALIVGVAFTSCVGTQHGVSGKATQKHAKKMNKMSGHKARCHKY